ncbi:PP2C family protein-serine/threonine phosphatase [Phenylobacterium terrae]|uniref:PP2C family protein-serine/threonine phosphatase n=1 Tax=Phenylobacterium terrae TaxID=2665495 RepID=A0ABW4MW55_9CAUL
MIRRLASRAEAARALLLSSAGRTHEGCVRRLNEDAFIEAPHLGLWAVADGMGGHEAGEVASGRVVDALAALPAPASGFGFVRDVSEALQAANAELIAYAAGRHTDVVGSTVVALLAVDGHYACLWAGDSRGYLWREGALCPLTRDHSLVQELVDSGALTPAEARTSRRGNVITRAVGVDPVLELAMAQGPMALGDVFLLCSDGLTGVLEDGEIADLLATAPGLDAAAEGLVAAALERGAPDNVTVVLVRAEAG